MVVIIEGMRRVIVRLGHSCWVTIIIMALWAAVLVGVGQSLPSLTCSSSLQARLSLTQRVPAATSWPPAEGVGGREEEELLLLLLRVKRSI